MNPQDAINAHFSWKVRLHRLLSGNLPDRLDPATVQVDNVCELGKWLHSGSSQVMPPTLRQELMTNHAGFHREAARIVREHYAGKKMGMDVLGPGSTLGELSLRITTLLMSLEHK